MFKHRHILECLLVITLVSTVSGDKPFLKVAEDLTAVESRYKVDAKPSPYKPPKPAPDFDYFAPTLNTPTESSFPVTTAVPASSASSFFTPTTLPPTSPRPASSTTSSTTATSTTTSASTSTFRKLFFPTSRRTTTRRPYPTFTATPSTTTTKTTTATTYSPSTTTTVSSSTPKFLNEIVSTTLKPISNSVSPKSYVRPFFKKTEQRRKPPIYYKVKKASGKLRKVKKILRTTSKAVTPSSRSTSPVKVYTESKKVSPYTQTKSPRSVVYTTNQPSKSHIKSLFSRKKFFSPSPSKYSYSPTTPYPSTTLAPSTTVVISSTTPTRSIRDPRRYRVTPSNPHLFQSTTTPQPEPSYYEKPSQPTRSRIRNIPIIKEPVQPIEFTVPLRQESLQTIEFTPVRNPIPITRHEPIQLHEPVQLHDPIPQRKLAHRRDPLPQRAPIQAPRPVKPREPIRHRNPASLNEVIHQEDHYSARPYSFSYDVKDAYTGTDFYRTEESSGPVTKGSYKVALPDGRVQIVNYVADKNGYKATVSYEGEALYPSPDSYNEAPTRRSFRHSRKVDLDSISGEKYALLRNRGPKAEGHSVRESTRYPQPVTHNFRQRVSRVEVKTLPPPPSRTTEDPVKSLPPLEYIVSTTYRPTTINNGPNYELRRRDYGLKVAN